MNAMKELFFPDRFWLSLELNALSHPLSSAYLDNSAVKWAPFGIRRPDFGVVRKCLGDLKASERSQCVLRWAGHHLGNILSSDLYAHSRFSLVNPNLLARVDHAFVHLHKSLLFDVATLQKNSYGKDTALSGILILLMEMVKCSIMTKDLRHPIFLKDFANLLVDICQSQHAANDWRRRGETIPFQDQRHKRVPTALLYECFDNHGYYLEPESKPFAAYCSSNQLKRGHYLITEALWAISWAAEQVKSRMTTQPTLSDLDLVFGSTAIALIAINQRSSEESLPDYASRCQHLLGVLNAFVFRKESHIIFKLRQCESEDPGSVRLVFHSAIHSIHMQICKLRSHRDADLKRLNDEFPQLLSRLAKLRDSVGAFNTSVRPFGSPRLRWRRILLPIRATQGLLLHVRAMAGNGQVVEANA